MSRRIVVSISDLSVSGLTGRDTGGSGRQDPYIILKEASTDRELERTERVLNRSSHTWEQEFAVSLSAEDRDPMILLEVWDHDRGADDLLGAATATIDPFLAGEQSFRLPLMRRGSARGNIRLSAEVEVPLASMPAVAPASSGPVRETDGAASKVITRESINAMPMAKQVRVMAAFIRAMLPNPPGTTDPLTGFPNYSEYFRLAGYHGNGQQPAKRQGSEAPGVSKPPSHTVHACIHTYTNTHVHMHDMCIHTHMHTGG